MRGVLLLLACAGTELAAAPRETLGMGDTIRVTVFQSPDLTAELRISERGTVVYPLVGELKLAGLTADDAGSLIGERLKQRRMVADPQVTVSVVQLRSRQVSVLGQVARPGKYPLDAPLSKLTDVLALAGGIGPTGADLVTVMVTKDGQPRKIQIDVPAMYRSGDMSRDIELHSGDMVFVERAPVFYIYGEVQRAGAFRLEPGTSVMQALSLGGGLTPRGTQRGLKIHRRAPDGSLRVIDAKAGDRVEADDILYVKERLF